MSRLLGVILSIYVVLLWILSGVMHLWTVWIAYKIFGIFMGGVSFFFPVISQIVIGFMGWRGSGFDSPYIQWLIVLAAAWVGYYAIGFIAGAVEDRQERKRYM